jgi:sugar phosphate isomerase/epimerase
MRAFTCTSDPLSHEAIVRYGPTLDADGLEVIFYPRWYQDIQRVARFLRSSALVFPVLHAEKSIGDCFGCSDTGQMGVQRFEQNCLFAQLLGVRTVVLHLWGMPFSDRQLELNLRLLPRCLDLAEQYGLVLAIETIPCTYADPLTNVKRVVDHDPRAALATEFLA